MTQMSHKHPVLRMFLEEVVIISVWYRYCRSTAHLCQVSTTKLFLQNMHSFNVNISKCTFEHESADFALNFFSILEIDL